MVALITGASRGIGRAIAIELAKQGYHLALTCKQHIEKLQEVATYVRNYPIECKVYQADIKDFEMAHEIVNDVLSTFDSLDILINNAGISYVGLLQDMTQMDWREVIDVNLSSVFNYSHAVIPHFLHKKRGHIINISSVWGEVGASMEVAYSASKAGIIGFTKALAKELAPNQIYVNAISAGLINTDMNKNLSSLERENLLLDIPIGRMATPEEVAQLVYKIATSDYLTAQVIRIDGGWL